MVLRSRRHLPELGPHSSKALLDASHKYVEAGIIWDIGITAKGGPRCAENDRA